MSGPGSLKQVVGGGFCVGCGACAALEVGATEQQRHRVVLIPKSEPRQRNTASELSIGPASATQ